MASRLATVSPELSVAIRQLDSSRQRAYAAAVSKWIIDSVSLTDARVEAGLNLLREGRFGDSPEREALDSLIEQLDEAAWQTQEEGRNDKAMQQRYLDEFVAARAASAVWSALDNDAAEAAMESAYEAQAAKGDLAGVRQIFDDLFGA